MRAPWDPCWRVQACLDPATAIAGAGLAMQAVGTITSAGAQYSQGQTQAAAAKAIAESQAQGYEISAAGAEYDAKSRATIDLFRGALSDFNAQIDLQKSQRYIDESEAQADIIRRSTGRALARTEASYAAAGVTMAGSPLAVLGDQATEGALQARLAIYGGQVQAQDARTQATLDTAQGDIYRAIATQEEGVGEFQAASYRQAARSALTAGSYGQAIADASSAGAGATLLTGLGKTAQGAYNLYSTVTGGASANPGASSNPNLSGFAPGAGPIGPSGGAVSY